MILAACLRSSMLHAWYDNQPGTDQSYALLSGDAIEQENAGQPDNRNDYSGCIRDKRA